MAKIYNFPSKRNDINQNNNKFSTKALILLLPIVLLFLLDLVLTANNVKNGAYLFLIFLGINVIAIITLFLAITVQNYSSNK